MSMPSPSSGLVKLTARKERNMSNNISPLSHPKLRRPAQALKRFAAARRCHHVGTLTSHVGSHVLMVSYGLHKGRVSRVARSLGLEGVEGNLARITNDAVLCLNPVPMRLASPVGTTFETRFFRNCEDLVRDRALERESRSAAISAARTMNRADDQTLLVQLAAAYRETQERCHGLPGCATQLGLVLWPLPWGEQALLIGRRSDLPDMLRSRRRRAA
jgi:hypothetical protein